MSRALEIIVKPAAKRDIKTEATYLRTEGGVIVERRFLDAVERTLSLLRLTPKMGMIHRPLMRDGLQLRWVPVTGAFAKRLIFYSHTSDQLRIERVLHQAREISRHLP